ncbi:myelin regulatory factor-like protein isoform X3 [Pimephales promelas]|uniref:myelin regulatory factor-like protein isoform X3 n=1 Tax=Pimephales promelas TaxID=90988 RepID=UPI001955C059|nr:myelin regulatory factor-like protein isoform X3 [Pimephales promelas]
MDVLGENEALQQFFNDSRWSTEQSSRDKYCQSEDSFPPSCPFKDKKPERCGGSGLMYEVGRTLGKHIKANSSASVPPYSLNTADSNIQATMSHNVPIHGILQYTQCSPMGVSAGHMPANAAADSSCVPYAMQPETVYPYMPPKHDQHVGKFLQQNKKRRRSNSFEEHTEQHMGADPVWAKPSFCPESGSYEAQSYDSDATGGSPASGVHQLLTWDQYQPNQWCSLHNNRSETLPPPGYHVDTDKGFSYSTADEAFVCQKKNHFQVTVHIGMVGDPRFVRTPAGLMPVESFYVKVFGVKFEAQNHFITIEQSQSDRSKKPFLPVRVNLPGDTITKVTLGRLHFCETTANNMRKKGKPNPDQRYFMMAVGLYATVKEDSFLLVAKVSEKIIVRASNPGQFENDSDVLWQRGQIPESVVCHGRIGINTDSPDEALVVCGNAKIMGNVMHPSDRRAKQNIQEVDSTEQLKRIAQMRIVEYDYKPEFASRMGIDQHHETGIIAQEVRELLPSAVREMGDVTCINGEKIDNFLMVDKEQIFMENVGAVKQLCKLTDNLENRIEELEVLNTRLAKLKTLGSTRSNSGPPAKGKINLKNTPGSKLPSPTSPKSPPLQSSKNYFCERYHHCLQHRVFQASIIMLVTTMALCVICIISLHMLTLQEDMDFNNSLNHTNVIPPYTTPTALTTAFSTTHPGPWPPDIDFSNVFYSDEVYCCPSTLIHDHNTQPTDTTMPFDFLSKTIQEKWLGQLPDKLKNSTDWTNTTIQSIRITQNQQVIDQQYCHQEDCGKGNYKYLIPLSKHIPPNMPITLQMSTNELLVIYLCSHDESEQCSTVLDYNSLESNTALNTQGYIHKWTLAVANHHRSSYYFRSSVAGLANCSTDPNYAEVLFTDYHFQFYRRCD